MMKPTKGQSFMDHVEQTKLRKKPSFDRSPSNEIVFSAEGLLCKFLP